MGCIEDLQLLMPLMRDLVPCRWSLDAWNLKGEGGGIMCHHIQDEKEDPECRGSPSSINLILARRVVLRPLKPISKFTCSFNNASTQCLRKQAYNPLLHRYVAVFPMGHLHQHQQDLVYITITLHCLERLSSSRTSFVSTVSYTLKRAFVSPALIRVKHIIEE